MRYFLVILLTILLSFGVWYVRFYRPSHLVTIPKTTNLSPTASQMQDVPEQTVLADNLDTPWAIGFLPDYKIIFTERPGRVRLVDSNKLLPDPIWIAPSQELGEGGLLGLAVDPEFANNNYVYLYYTTQKNVNRVTRLLYQNSKLEQEKILLDNIPASKNHDGGRIKFGPDGYLYVTTGDAENMDSAQDKSSLAGKILRMTKDGKPVPDNPFHNFTYSYGHRNPQGLVWDQSGNLWATEHGRSFPVSGLDEINLIEKGGNYGWPVIQGDELKSGMKSAVLNSGSETWAPAGIAYFNNSLFFGGLKGSVLYEASLEGEKIKNLKEHYKGQFGRIREVILGPDKMLYISTSNKDGRGEQRVEDDKIIRLNPLKIGK